MRGAQSVLAVKIMGYSGGLHSILEYANIQIEHDN